MKLLGRGARFLSRLLAAARAYFAGQDPTFAVAFAPALLASIALFVRSPVSNYIFDEQEALLANPYVHGRGLGFWSAFTRDFWGLPPERSIGSYRPLPNLVWRALWHVSEQPFIHHWANVVGHALNSALLAAFVFAASGRRRLSWLAGTAFLSSAILTEAIAGVVGLADVMGGLGVLLALHALRLRLWGMPFAVLVAMSFGLFSKESAIVAVPLVAWAALTSAPLLHEARPLKIVRAACALLAATAALVAYTELRRRWFPVALPEALAAPLAQSEPWSARALHAFLRWFHQPSLPRDPINNPLVDAPFRLRLAAALRVYASGAGQVLLPWTLSGDYSFRAEPVPPRPIFFGSVVGALLFAVPPLSAIGLWLASEWRARGFRSAPPCLRRFELAPPLLLALGLMWFPIAYFPHSNIPVLLPTVRAERFWYLPAVGTSLLLACGFDALLRPGLRRYGSWAIIAFFAFQAVRARLHALDYVDDLSFWDATRRAVPASAKAQLNYSVMLGARGKLDERLRFNRIAKELAPEWPMAHIYYGDTLCRLHRAEQAIPHYLKGFDLGPNDPNLVALALQCMWDEKVVAAHRDELAAAAERHPGSWVAFLVTDLLDNGETHGGVQKKYRPRSYDEGPKSD